MRLSSVEYRGRMIRGLMASCCGAVLLAACSSSFAQSISMQALTTFGSNGWLAPASFATGGTGDAIRDLAFNPVTGNLLVATSTTAIPVNAVTGTFGTALLTGGTITGGARGFNTVAVTSDGVIYGGNLSTNSTTSPYKVYRWADQAATPTLHYSGNAGLAGARIGDDLAAFGADATGFLAAGFGSSPSVAGNNSYTTVNTGSSGGAAAAVAYTGGAAGDYRLGITIADANTVLGTQAQIVRQVSFLGTSGTLDFSTTLNVLTERGLLYFTAYGTPLLATQEWGSGATTNTVRLYNATNLLSAGSVSFIQSINLTTSTNANGNAIGGIAYGEVNGTPTIYALSTNNGIQALQIVPEPSTMLVVGACSVGLSAMMLRRRNGRKS